MILCSKSQIFPEKSPGYSLFCLSPHSWWCLREWVSHGASIPRPQECQSFRSCDALPCSCHALPVPQNHFFPALPSHLPLLAAQQEEGRRPFCLIRCGWVGGWAVEHAQFSGTLVFMYITVNCSTGLWVIMLSYLGAGWNVSHVYSLLLLSIGSFNDTCFIERNICNILCIFPYIFPYYNFGVVGGNKLVISQIG